MRIPVWISNRHVHLCQNDLDRLFGKWYELTLLKKLSQPNAFSCNETVCIVGPKKTIEKVRIVWPLRKATQVEISVADSFLLWVKPELRISWDLEGSPWIKLIWPNWSVDVLQWMIVAKRHLHCTVKEAEEMWLKNWQNIKIKTWWKRAIIWDNVEVRVKDNYVLDFHLDIEEADAAGLSSGAWWEIVGS
jgi:putative phosphotransacetylase